ncbi:hypothetical protein [Halalkalibacter krulwichiae]|uniref:Uncharacterized protein n=1 Tax=Halalkalibacter krulwichiae TaxID=199441 RepID=A0A1X9MBH3_9BACI|nr:hypothetical protein [Halalkalibacter krulwichiae]ARK30785.1 hypothetical protein BkAM31D_13590 [Halalkalibacter krulwichiae]
MRYKIIMDSGKEYIVNNIESHSGLLKSFYNENGVPMGGKVRVLKNTFLFLDEEETIMINPSHISSIEVVGE